MNYSIDHSTIASISTADVVRQDGVALQRSGKNLVASCPLPGHQERTGSFTIFGNGNGWKCFGCGLGGTALDYVILRAGGNPKATADRATGIRRLIDLRFLPDDNSRPATKLAPLPPVRIAVSQPLPPAAPPPRRAPDAIHNFRNSDGEIVYAHKRWYLTAEEQEQYPGQTKIVRPYHGDGLFQIGEPKGRPLPFYGLPALLAADPTRPVFLSESETDADALMALGAVCVATGGPRWQPHWASAFIGRDVVLLPHNDLAGETLTATVVAALHPYAASVRILRLPHLPDHGDVRDWLADGGTLDLLGWLAHATPNGNAAISQEGNTGAGEAATLIAGLQEQVGTLQDHVTTLRARVQQRDADFLQVTKLMKNRHLTPSTKVVAAALYFDVEGQRANATQADPEAPPMEEVQISYSGLSTSTGLSSDTVARGVKALDKAKALQRRYVTIQVGDAFHTEVHVSPLPAFYDSPETLALPPAPPKDPKVVAAPASQHGGTQPTVPLLVCANCRQREVTTTEVTLTFQVQQCQACGNMHSPPIFLDGPDDVLAAVAHNYAHTWMPQIADGVSDQSGEGVAHPQFADAPPPRSATPVAHPQFADPLTYRDRKSADAPPFLTDSYCPACGPGVKCLCCPVPLGHVGSPAYVAGGV